MGTPIDLKAIEARAARDGRELYVIGGAMLLGRTLEQSQKDVAALLLRISELEAENKRQCLGSVHALGLLGEEVNKNE